jgi:cytochrome c oxidase assembly protein subunit 15
MSTYLTPAERKNHRAAALVTGFGATVAMWGAGYVARLPAVEAPVQVLFALLVLCLLGGGYAAGATTGSTRAGALSGLVSSLLNLLILGSLLASPHETNQLHPAAFLYVPGFFLLGAGVGWVGAFLGAGAGSGGAGTREWANWMAHIAAIATLLLIGAGGLVTTKGAGMDVPDWPNSFGYNMFLYPLSRMTGGIYYEHAHRLFGTLVGLSMLTLAIYLQRNETRRWLKALAWSVFALVCVQGVLGGVRVTENSLALAAIHGVVGQAIFALMVVIAAASTREFHEGPAPRVAPGYGTERFLGWLLIVLILVQISLGALLRHFSALLHAHISVAVVVILVAGFAGFRAWGLYPDVRPLKKVGVVLLILALVQLALGFAALIFRGFEPDHRTRTAVATLVITAHQAVGALLLATVGLHSAWVGRRLRAGSGEES